MHLFIRMFLLLQLIQSQYSVLLMQTRLFSWILVLIQMLSMVTSEWLDVEAVLRAVVRMIQLICVQRVTADVHHLLNSFFLFHSRSREIPGVQQSTQSCTLWQTIHWWEYSPYIFLMGSLLCAVNCCICLLKREIHRMADEDWNNDPTEVNWGLLLWQLRAEIIVRREARSICLGTYKIYQKWIWKKICCEGII